MLSLPVVLGFYAGSLSCAFGGVCGVCVWGCMMGVCDGCMYFKRERDFGRVSLFNL